jgi:hypothetical protein
MFMHLLHKIVFKLFMHLLHKIVFKLFMNLLHKSFVFDNEGIVYAFVTTECCL